MTELMFQRRDVLKISLCGIGSAMLGADPASAEDQGQTPPSKTPSVAGEAPPSSVPPPIAGSAVTVGPPVDFTQNTLIDTARALAQAPYKPIAADLPAPFNSLTPDQYGNIRLKPDATIWAGESVGFAIAPLHRGFQYVNPIEINLVAQGKAYRLTYTASLFDFGKLGTPAKIGDIGFSGFRVLMPQGDGSATDLATFQGTNFFHAQAPGQREGVMARALALNIGDPRGEVMPLFRAMWIEKPSLVANLLIVHAIVDSESVVATFRFTIRPGEATIIDTECTLLPRKDVDNFGLAAMSATHLLGFLDHKKFDDYRPNVSEVCGVQMLTGRGEWIWRPVSNGETLQTSTFVDSKPRGFGCIIRDRDFDDYDDEEQHWEQRPSLWIEPIGDWAEGGVQLIEIPSQSDANDNILCFWRPKAALKAGSDLSLAYRQFWCWEPPVQPDLAKTCRSRAGSAGKRRRFFVEFRGDILGDAKRTVGLSPTLSAGGGSITMMKTFADPEHKAFRVLFELDPGSADACELRLLLSAQGKPVSETWLYRWTAS